MVVGLTFYQFWYSNVPKEMLLTDSEEVAVPRQTNDNTNSQEAVTDYPHNSDSSIKEQISSTGSDGRLHRENSVRVINRMIEIENPPQNFQPQGFYANSNEDTGNNLSLSNHGVQFQYPLNFSALGEYRISLPFLFPEKYYCILDFHMVDFCLQGFFLFLLFIHLLGTNSMTYLAEINLKRTKEQKLLLII
ncbi:uncharacterized protein LOC112095263 [Morus notabilis]|uniref:uncharacterized protein LOC112095263 n=1 Tax=Morus notabilis TaxID=981085 RepID=UPI000CECF064|nr:uncharacterized protein LOC112095263 [Morus notabilis]